jgi:hypothetical protein
MKRGRVAWLAIVASAVVVALAVLFFPREYRAAVVGYRLTDDPRQITLHANVGPGDAVIGGEVLREDAGSVTLIVKARDVSSSNIGEGDSVFVTVTLRDPIGDRKVVDATQLPGLSGHIVPRVP